LGPRGFEADMSRGSAAAYLAFVDFLHLILRRHQLQPDPPVCQRMGCISFKFWISVEGESNYITSSIAKAPSFHSTADIKTQDHLLARSLWHRKRGKEVLALG
jgi:hypothetical protein